MEHVRIESKNDVMNFLCANRDRLHALGVMRIGLFGSYVRGEQQAGSDVDLLVEFETGRKSFDAFMELSFWLEAIMQRRVELVTLESLSPYIGPRILKEVEFAPITS